MTARTTPRADATEGFTLRILEGRLPGVTVPPPTHADAREATTRRYGPPVGEPPPHADPRRWGSLIGVIGGLVFVGYSSALGDVLAVVAWVPAVGLAAATLFGHVVRPVALGPLVRPRPLALATYVASVAGELALIAVGTRALAAAGRSELQPALITAVVGLHFLPFAWAFRERMFVLLGGLLLLCGGVGAVAGALGVTHAADALAVLAGELMLAVLALYARGRFARPGG